MSDLYADCPFCGAANSGTHYHTDDSGKWGALACPSCDARGPEIRTNYATSPADLWKARDPYGPQQDDELRTLSEYAALTGMPIVCGWGIHGGSWNKPIIMLQTHSPNLACLGRTKDGKPRHPLYVRADQPLEGFLT